MAVGAADVQYSRIVLVSQNKRRDGIKKNDLFSIIGLFIFRKNISGGLKMVLQQVAGQLFGKEIACFTMEDGRRYKLFNTRKIIRKSGIRHGTIANRADNGIHQSVSEKPLRPMAPLKFMSRSLAGSLRALKGHSLSRNGRPGRRGPGRR
jgi:hypothetical protein